LRSFRLQVECEVWREWEGRVYHSCTPPTPPPYAIFDLKF
jgi:hypothetical protein